MIPYDNIREHYKYLTPLIYERSLEHPCAWVAPYCSSIDWVSIFTPIEYDTWHSIRSHGGIPLYPQYPILKYFIDFANPFLKIGVECDGANFHLDKKKDNDRDFELKQAGWKIYRISGSDCWRVPKDEYYDLMYLPKEDRYDILKEFYESTVDGLIKALSIVYCENGYYEDDDISEYCIAEEILNKRLSKPIKNWINVNNMNKIG
jgi:hypothetical protein